MDLGIAARGVSGVMWEGEGEKRGKEKNGRRERKGREGKGREGKGRREGRQ